MATKSNPETNIFREWIQTLPNKRIRTLRLISQTAFFLLFNGVIFGLSRIDFPVPVVMPPAAPFATVWGGFSALQYIMTRGQFPFLVIGVFFLTGSLFGKLTCGWACPIGFWQDLIAMLPLSKVKVGSRDNRDFQGFAAFFFWLAVGTAIIVGYLRNTGRLGVDDYFTIIPYATIDPAGTMLVTYFYAFFWGILPGDNFINAFFTTTGTIFLIKSGILLLVTYISIRIPRAYCRWICPTGYLLGVTSSNSLLTVKRDPVKCEDGCKACEDACPTGVPITEENTEGIESTLCIMCGDCIDACPDAMSYGFRF